MLLQRSCVGFFFLSRYFLHLHFTCYLQSPLLRNPPTSASWPWHSPVLGDMIFARPRASPPIDGQLDHPLLHMQLETQVPPCVFFDWWFIPRELWGYWLVHIVVPPIGLQTPSAPWGTFSSSFTGDPVLCLMDDYEHPHLYLSGTGRASQETAMSGSTKGILMIVFTIIYPQ